MSKILYIGWNGYGHVNPSLSLVRKLVEKGHDVVLRRRMEEAIELNTSYEKKIFVSFGSILCSSEDYLDDYNKKLEAQFEKR